jgi:hypothetical protein
LDHGAELGTPIRFGSTITLQHNLTQKLLAKRPGDAGHQTHRIFLKPPPVEGEAPPEQCWFRPMPRIKLYSEGDPIKFDSQVLIESAHGIGSRLRLHLGENTDELDASHVRSTGIRIKLFAPFGISGHSYQHVLKGGDFVRLYHQEHNAMLEVVRIDESVIDVSAGALDSNLKQWGADDDSFLSNDNTLCLRGLVEDRGPSEATNASSLWQVELNESAQGGYGRPVTWQDDIRLKNVLSEAYLDLTKRTQTGARGVSQDRGQSNLLNFSCAMDNNFDMVDHSSPIYVRGIDKQWLHATSETAISDEKSKQRYHALDFVSSKSDENAFNLQLVDLKDVQNLSRAKSDHGTLQKMFAQDPKELASLAGKLRGDVELRDYIRALDSMLAFCTADRRVGQREISDHQRTLADLRVDDELMQFISKPFHATKCEWKTTSAGEETWPELLVTPKMGPYNSLVRRCYSVLRQMCVGNAENGYHVASKFKDMMLRQCQLVTALSNVYWDIVSVLQAMYTNNPLLIRTLSEPDLKIYTSLISAASSVKEHRMYLTLLSLMCAHNDDAVIGAQDAIRNALLQIIPKTRINSRGLVEIEKTVPDNQASQHIDIPGMADIVEELLEKEGHTWKSLEEFADSPENALYLVALTDLLTNLCLNRRRKSIGFVRQHFAPFNIAMAVLTNRNIEASVRAGFVALVRKLYVDIDPFESNPQINARIWSDVTDEEGARFLAADIENVVPGHPKWADELMTWSQCYFVQEGPHLQVKTADDRRFGGIRDRSKSRTSKSSGFRNSVTSFGRPSHSSRGSSDSGRTRGIMLASEQGGQKAWGTIRVKLSMLTEREKERKDEIGSNRLCSQVLGLLGDMVRHGFCRDAETRVSLLRALVKLLSEAPRSKDGLDEEALTSQQRGAITEAKRAACDLLYSLNRIWANSFLPELLLAFRKEYSNLGEGGNIVPPLEGWLERLPSIKEQDKHGGFFWFNQQSEECIYVGHSPDDAAVDVVCILLDLCQYGDTRLTESALRLLLGTFNLKREIISLLNGVSLTTDVRQITSLPDLRRQKKRWYEVSTNDSALYFDGLLELVEWFAAQLDCRLGAESVKLRQKMIRCERIHMAVVSVIREHTETTKSEQLKENMLKFPALRRLLCMSFEFIGMFVADNPINQAEFITAGLFEFMVHATSLGLGAEVPLSRILNHADAVRLVRHGTITHALVNNLFLFEHCRTPQYLEMMKVIVAPKGTISEDQQTKLVSSIISTRHMVSHETFSHQQLSTGGSSPLFFPTERSTGLAYSDNFEAPSLASLWQPTGADEHELPPDTDWMCNIAEALGRKTTLIEKMKRNFQLFRDKTGFISDRTHPRTGAKFESVFFGNALVQLLIENNIAETREDAAKVGQVCVEIGYIVRKDGGFGLHDFVDGRILFRLVDDAPANEGRVNVPSTIGQIHHGSKPFVVEYYLALMQFLTTLCGHNPYTRGLLLAEAPFLQSLAPIISNAFTILPSYAKITYIELAHTLHLFTIRPEEIVVYARGGGDGDGVAPSVDDVTGSSSRSETFASITANRLVSMIQLGKRRSLGCDSGGCCLVCYFVHALGACEV